MTQPVGKLLWRGSSLSRMWLVYGRKLCVPAGAVSLSHSPPQRRYVSRRHNNPAFVEGQHTGSVPPPIYFSFSLLTLIYGALKSRPAFSPLYVRMCLSRSGPPPTPPLHDLTPSSQKLFEVSGSLTFLVSSKRRTRCNFLLILSSPCSPEESSVTCGQRQRVAEQREPCSGGNKMRGEGQEAGPVTAPNQASLPLLSLSACSLDSQNFPDSVIVKVHRKLIRV